MALTFDWTRAPHAEQLTPTERQALIFATIAVGIGDVTGTYADEYVARVRLYERVFGAYVDGPDGPVPFTTERLLLAVGLCTNVAYEPRGAWLARVMARSLDDAEREASDERVARDGVDPEPPAARRRASVVTFDEVEDALMRVAADASRRVHGDDLRDWFDALDYDAVDKATDAVNRLAAEAVACKSHEE